MTWVDWYKAIACCAWAGTRLPTEAEWEKAARGTSVRAFPWGDQAHDCALANYGSYEEYFCVGDTSAVGSDPLGASPYGALGMAGNVEEWVNDWWQVDYYSASPYLNPIGPPTGTHKVLRGGSRDLYGGGKLRTAYRYNDVPDLHDYGIGFRCASSSGN